MKSVLTNLHLVINSKEVESYTFPRAFDAVSVGRSSTYYPQKKEEFDGLYRKAKDWVRQQRGYNILYTLPYKFDIMNKIKEN